MYRAVDSTGATIDFLLSAKRDAAAAKRFLQKALRSPGHPRPRVINVDRNPSYPKAMSELKQSGELGRRCRCRPVRYLNNIVEQDHRAVKRRVRAMSGLPGISLGVANASGNRDHEHDSQRTGQVVGESDITGQVAFINGLFGLAPRLSPGRHEIRVRTFDFATVFTFNFATHPMQVPTSEAGAEPEGN